MIITSKSHGSLSISNGWDDEDVFVKCVQLFANNFSILTISALSSTPTPNYSPSPRKSLASNTEPDDDEAGLWSAFEDDGNVDKDTPKKGYI